MKNLFTGPSVNTPHSASVNKVLPLPPSEKPGDALSKLRQELSAPEHKPSNRPQNESLERIFSRVNMFLIINTPKVSKSGKKIELKYFHPSSCNQGDGLTQQSS